MSGMGQVFWSCLGWLPPWDGPEGALPELLLLPPAFLRGTWVVQGMDHKSMRWAEPQVMARMMTWDSLSRVMGSHRGYVSRSRA